MGSSASDNKIDGLGEDREFIAKSIMDGLEDHFLLSDHPDVQEFVLKTIAITLVMLVKRLGKSRTQFVFFMLTAWDKHTTAERDNTMKH